MYTDHIEMSFQPPLTREQMQGLAKDRDESTAKRIARSDMAPAIIDAATNGQYIYTERIYPQQMPYLDRILVELRLLFPGCSVAYYQEKSVGGGFSPSEGYIQVSWEVSVSVKH